MLPLNWQRVRLGDIANYLISNLSAEQITQQGKIKVYDANNFIGYTDTTFISDKPYISIVKDGSVGRVRILPPKTNILSTMGALIANHRTTTEFLFYLLSNFDFKNFTSGSIIPHIYFKDYKEKTISLPPLNEQIAIANILSDLDRYLCALRALILKKESVKKALSFELLSQRKRLKGFNQNWQRVRLGDICEFGNGGAYETLIVENGDFKLISLNSIDIDGNLKNTMKRVNFYDNSLKQDDIVMVLSDVAHGDFLGLCAVIPSNDYVLNQRMGRLRIRNDCINILFLRLYINANQKYFKMQGQGSSQLNLSKKAIEDFEILLPPLNEQIAIANILSALDHEIISLKNKKRQFENIKKALNHDLMSAKIRVLKK